VIRTRDAWTQAVGPLVEEIQTRPYVIVLMPDGEPGVTSAPSEEPEHD
jgi:hypothetical protein